MEEIEVPPDLLERWQGVVDTLAEVADTPAGLIMKANPPYIEVFRSSRTDGNPYEVGDRENLTGLYCEEVIESGEKLFVEDAREDEDWNENPDLELGMVNYFGYPLNWPNGNPFGTMEVSHWSPDQDRDVEEALNEADKKMYEDKRKND